MNTNTKVLIACVVLVGLWIGFQQMQTPNPGATPACDSATSGG